jgi:hypothetical protein
VKVIQHIWSEYAETIFFVLRWLNISCWSRVQLYIYILHSEYSKLFGHLHRINLYVYWEHMDWIYTYTENTRNEVSLQTEFCGAYLLNMHNGSTVLLRIQGMNLCVYWEYTNESVRMYKEYAEIIKVNYQNQNWKYFRTVIRSPDRSIWPNPF